MENNFRYHIDILDLDQNIYNEIRLLFDEYKMKIKPFTYFCDIFKDKNKLVFVAKGLKDKKEVLVGIALCSCSRTFTSERIIISDVIVSKKYRNNIIHIYKSLFKTCIDYAENLGVDEIIVDCSDLPLFLYDFFEFDSYFIYKKNRRLENDL